MPQPKMRPVRLSDGTIISLPVLTDADLEDINWD